MLSKFITKPINNAYIYNRVSTLKQAGIFKHSLAHQEKICKNYIDNYYPNIPISVYMDIGSTYNNKNTLYNLKKMVNHMETSSLIIITDISRLGRNIDQVFKILKKVEDKKSYIISIHNELCYNHTKIMNKQFLHKIIDSENDSDLLSFRIKNTQSFIKNNGGYIGNTPFGYKTEKNKNNIPILVENKFEIENIDYIIELADKNTDYYEIATILNNESIKNRNKEWTNKSVKRILDKFYPEHMLIDFNQSNHNDNNNIIINNKININNNKRNRDDTNCISLRSGKKVKFFDIINT